MRRLVAKSRLVVNTYDSTTLLEALAANRPVMGFWRGRLDHVNEQALPFYEKLVGAGIVWLEPGMAAEHINEHWGDIGKWWEDKKTQRAREGFCSMFSRTSKTPAETLKKILKSI